MTHERLVILLVLIAATVALAGCGDGKTDPDRPNYQAQRRAEFDAKVRERWGKGIDELPQEKLIAISPHHNDIQNEFEMAFSLFYALEQGKTVDIEWREIGGGSNSILTYLRNIYGESDTAKIDIIWGGGDRNFQSMAAEGILQKMKLPAGFAEAVPQNYGGLPMYDPNGYWAGAAISGFGILYNKTLLEQLGVAPPQTWDDLGDPRFHNLLALADPTKSGSALASYEMIVQSAGGWSPGWGKLLGVLGNTKRFYSGASDAAEAVLSAAPVATCIDFYGKMRVDMYPEDLVYISPKGQTAYNPDPIGILKNPPNPHLAQAFCYFVLSKPGQALWALPVGAKDGPVETPLYRTPIRQDVFEDYKGKLLASIQNPFIEGKEMKIDRQLWDDSFGLLKHLVWSAAITNLDGLKDAKKAVDAANSEPLRKSFVELPANVDEQSDLSALNDAFADKARADEIETAWQSYFREKYQKLVNR